MDSNYITSTRALILVPTKELSEQVTSYLRKLLIYCDKTIKVTNIASGASGQMQKCVFISPYLNPMFSLTFLVCLGQNAPRRRTRHHHSDPSPCDSSLTVQSQHILAGPHSPLAYLFYLLQRLYPLPLWSLW